MQERKYRGISYETNTFVYGWLHQTKYESSKYFIRTFPNEDDDYVDVVVYKSTIGQEIGQTDKYGVKIFEDDIVKDENGRLFVIEYKFGGFNLVPIMCLNDEFSWNPLGDMQTAGFLNESCEVIGNLWENPELLSEN